MIVGVDVSSRRIDLAWLEDGKPQRWHQDLPDGHLIDRLKAIRVEWPSAATRLVERMQSFDVTDVAIEMPFGQSRKSVGALMAVTGIVTRQAPPWARVAWPSSGELRAAIGAKNTKQSAHEMIVWGELGYGYSPDMHLGPTTLEGWDEHELDALVACVGWTRILAAQEDAE